MIENKEPRTLYDADLITDPKRIKSTINGESAKTKNAIIRRTRRPYKGRISRFQIFTLLFLYNEESKESQKRAILRNQTVARNYYPGLPKASPHISLRELAMIIPDSSLLSNIIRSDQMYEELKLLEINELITAEWDRDYDKDNYVLSLSTNGIILVKRYLSQLPHLTEQSEYIENIEKAESSSEIKDWLLELKDKIKGKTQDEIADIVVNGAKKYGLTLFTSLIHLANQGS